MIPGSISGLLLEEFLLTPHLHNVSKEPVTVVQPVFDFFIPFLFLVLFGFSVGFVIKSLTNT
jgi:hypothetical protein